MGPLESTQLHDVNPGDMNVPGANNYFLDGGLFWTRRIPEKSVKTHPGRGDASFVASNLEMFDYFTAPNAILRPPGGRAPVDASASVDIQWAGNGERLYVHNGAADFAGHYENASAQVNWVIANANGYHFSTANSSDVHVTHAYTAQVRTGSFHHG